MIDHHARQLQNDRLTMLKIVLTAIVYGPPKRHSTIHMVFCV